jgi:NitT/TauT family transport system permease protein
VLGAQWRHLLIEGAYTLVEAGVGFLAGIVVALGLAILFQFSRGVERAIYPHAIALKAIPLVALAPLVTVWAGTGMTSKVILAAIISFFPVLVNAAQGLSSVEPEAVELLRSMSANRWQILIKLRLPAALPSILAGMKVASTFAVIGAVVAEFISSSRGIGNVARSSSYYLSTDVTFAAIIVMAVLSLMFFGAVVCLERLLVPWQAGRN